MCEVVDRDANNNPITDSRVTLGWSCGLATSGFGPDETTAEHKAALKHRELEGGA